MRPLIHSPRAAAAAGLLAAALAAPLAAQNTCIPFAGGVPAAPGPPVWWTGAVPSVFATKVNDPRWVGSVGHSFGTGATEHVKFRALVNNEGGGKALYLSWHVKVDPSLDNNQDLLYVGLVPQGGQQPLILKVTTYNSSGSDLEAAAPAGIEAMTWNGAQWGVVATPAWATSHTRVWLKHTAPYEWAVHMHVPVNALGADQGVNLPEPFTMWYEVQVQAGGMSVPYHWPRAADAISIDPNTFQNVFPAQAQWGTFRKGNAVADPQCAIGVSLAYSDVGTNNAPSSQINLVSPNTFFAKPLNQTGGALAANTIQATFRIANWGSQPDWNQVADPTQLWSDIPNGTLVNNAAPIANTAKGSITFNWTLSAAERTPFQNGTKRPHQCMLVELSSTANVTFLNTSLYRNMDFVNASEFRREAEINVGGIKAGANGVAGELPAAHPVMLFTEKRNLPRSAKEAPQLDTAGLWDGRERELLQRMSQLPDSVIQVMADKGDITQEQLQRLLPTYVVHVYRGDGERVDKGGTVFPIAQPQSSFGYFVKHDGPLAGWSTGLGGAAKGKVPNVYTVDVPQGGKVEVVNVVMAHEDQVPASDEIEVRVQGTSPTDSTKNGGGGDDRKCGLGGAGTVVVLLGMALLGLTRRSWMRG